MGDTTEILIIGGGSIGLNSAYFLAKAGHQVTLIDRSVAGVGSSSGNAGHIVPSHIVPLAAPGVIWQSMKWLLQPATSPFSLRPKPSFSYLRWLTSFAANCNAGNVHRSLSPLDSLGRLSSRLFKEIIASEQIGCHYRQNGLLFLYLSETALQAGWQEAEECSSMGVRAELLDSSGVRAREPLAAPEVCGGVFYPDDANLDPALFLAGLKRAILAAGGRILENVAVRGLLRQGKAITGVTTDSGEMKAQQVVLACGAWSEQFSHDLGIRIPVQPARGYSLTIATDGPKPSCALLLGERKVAVTAMGDQLRITGRLELGYDQLKVSDRQLAKIREAASHYLTCPLPDSGQRWVGLRPTTPDGLPIICKVRALDNLFLATGHAMLGLSLGPATGKVISELVTGQQPSLELSPFRLERF